MILRGRYRLTNTCLIGFITFNLAVVHCKTCAQVNLPCVYIWFSLVPKWLKYRKRLRNNTHTCCEQSVVTYGAETWTITKRCKENLLSEVDILRRSCRRSTEYPWVVRNADIRKSMDRECHMSEEEGRTQDTAGRNDKKKNWKSVTEEKEEGHLSDRGA